MDLTRARAANAGRPGSNLIAVPGTSYDPADGIRLPEIPRRKIVPLTLDEVDALTEGMPARYRALVVVGAATGLRQG
ncbi:hypothetical protein ABZ754_26805 [Micromonospora purpureochromogenes]|uniref:hypothetical protein n=1 Tax=Micromonospora purpureochromogenes TaxID=47872 RepID=UPI0033C9C044